MMPTFNTEVRRSYRIYNMVEFRNKTPSDQRLQPSLGSFQGTLFVRQKILNPKTGRLVYVDGVVGQGILHNHLGDTIVSRDIHLGDTTDAMDVSLDDFLRDIHLGDTILAKTIKINRLENTIQLQK